MWTICPETYHASRRWLRVGGLLSHQIDFRSHQMTRKWNGHWACSDFLWKLMKGRRRYLLNREPCSRHIELMAEQGFAIVGIQRTKVRSDIARDDLSPRFMIVTNEELATSGALIQALER